MSLGLLLSAVVSIVVASIPAVAQVVIGSREALIVALIVQLGIVWFLSARYQKMSIGAIRAAFIIYAILSGATLSVIFFVFQTISIISVFFGTMVLFGLLALYGMFTKRDLALAGQVAFAALFGLIAAAIVNLFVGGSVFDLIIAWAGVIIFSVITPSQVQKIKLLGQQIHSEDELQRLSVVSALGLYLAFINLFLNLLRIFGRRK